MILVQRGLQPLLFYVFAEAFVTGVLKDHVGLVHILVFVEIHQLIDVLAVEHF